MPTTAETFGIARGNLHEPRPINILPPLPQCSDDNKEEMAPPRRHEDADDFNMREAMHVLMLASTSMCKAMEAQSSKADTGNGAMNRRVSWLMAIFAMVTLMGAGANFLTTSSFAVGGKQQELHSTQKDVERLQQDMAKLAERNGQQELKLREYEVWLQTTREKLSDKGWRLPPIPKGE